MKRLLLVGLSTVAASLFGVTCTYDGSWDVLPSGESDVIVVRSGDLKWDATLPAFVIPGKDAEGNPGKIVWKQGLVLLVR